MCCTLSQHTPSIATFISGFDGVEGIPPTSHCVVVNKSNSTIQEEDSGDLYPSSSHLTSQDGISNLQTLDIMEVSPSISNTDEEGFSPPETLSTHGMLGDPSESGGLNENQQSVALGRQMIVKSAFVLGFSFFHFSSATTCPDPGCGMDDLGTDFVCSSQYGSTTHRCLVNAYILIDTDECVTPQSQM